MVKAVEKAEPAKDDATKAEEPSKEEAETAELKKIADYLRGRKGIAVRARIVSSSLLALLGAAALFSISAVPSSLSATGPKLQQ